MIDFIQSILGTYTPVIYQYFDVAMEQYHEVIPAGASGVDWPYIIGGVAFCIMLYSVFRIIGIFVEKL